MNNTEFFNALRDTAAEWKLNDSTLRADSEHCLMCPITAVYKHVTGESIDLAMPMTAARRLGLDMKFAAAVAVTSNGDDSYPEIKQKLYDICGVDNETL